MTSVVQQLVLLATFAALAAPCALATQTAPAAQPEPAPESIESLRTKAGAGDAESQYELATRLRHGSGVEKDLPQAFAWMKKAAEQGYAPAFAYVGLHLLDGLGIPEDAAEAVKWFERGVAKDDAHAHYHLAFCLQDGRGVEKDLEAAFRHFQTAALKGHASAQFEVASCLEQGNGTTTDWVAARAAYEKAAAADHVGAMACFGNWLVHGVGGGADVARGMKLLKEADDRGDGWAAALLGDFHLDGEFGVAKDLAKAKACYVRSAERCETGASRLRHHFPGEHLDLVDQCYDLSLEFEVGEPLLIEIEREGKTRGRLELKAPSGPVVVDKSEDSKSQTRLVDEFLELGDEWRAKRHVVTAQTTRDGKPCDPEINGAELLLASDPEGDGSTIELVGGRLVSAKSMEGLERQIDSAGVDVGLPRKARIGEQVRLDLDLVVPLLFESDGSIEDAVAEVALERFDATKLLAELSGRGTAREWIEEAVERVPGMTMKMRADYEYEIALVVDLARRAIASIEMEGRGTLDGGGTSPDDKLRAKVDATVEFSVKLQTKNGSVASQARREKPKFRDVERDLPKVGVRAKLASHFFDATHDEETSFLSALGEEKLVVVALQSFPIGTQAMAQVMKETEAALLKNAPAGTKAKDVRCGIGKGRAVAFTVEGEHIDVEIYPLGDDRLLRLRFAGTEAAKRSVRDEIARFRESLKRLE